MKHKTQDIGRLNWRGLFGLTMLYVAAYLAGPVEGGPFLAGALVVYALMPFRVPRGDAAAAPEADTRRTG